jgi:hypothetical protein
MIENLFKFLGINKQNPGKIGPKSLRKRLKVYADETGLFTFPVSLNEEVFKKLSDEWNPPRWTDTFESLLRMIKRKIMEDKKFNVSKKKGPYDFLPLPPKSEKNLIVFFKPEEKDNQKTGKYIITDIITRDTPVKKKK